MKVPNWQHHSKKDQKRSLKPQAMRQAKKRRAALKRKLLAASVVLVGISSPAQAITWGEFWGPFRSDHHHHYHRPRYCTQEEYREVRDRYGRFVSYHYETVRVPCWKKYHDRY